MSRRRSSVITIAAAAGTTAGCGSSATAAADARLREQGGERRRPRRSRHAGAHGGAPRRRAARAEPPGPTAGTAVRIDGFAFTPRALSVKAGQSVTWQNADAAPRTVTENRAGFDSKELAGGRRYTRRFTEAGRFEYPGALHPGMTGTGTVTVTR